MSRRKKPLNPEEMTVLAAEDTDAQFLDDFDDSDSSHASDYTDSEPS